MYNVSQTFLNKIKEPSRVLDAKVIVGNTTLGKEEIASFSVESTLGNSDMPGIGGVIAGKLSLKLIRIGNTPSYYTTQTIKPSVAIDDGVGNFMWVPLGEFYPDPTSITRTDQLIEIECFDILAKYEDMIYETSLSYPTNIRNVANEMISKYKVPFKDVNQLPSINYKVKPQGQSIRSVIAEMAELATANAIVDNEGKIVFKRLADVAFTLNANNYIDFTLESDNDVKITKLICEKEETDADGNEIADLEYGNTDGATLRFQNASITTSAELKTIYDRMFPRTYTAYEMRCQGMPHLQVGDIITLVDKKNVSRKLPIITHTLTFSGGLVSEMMAKAPASGDNSTGSNGSNSITNTVQQLTMDSLTVNHILAGNITADNIAANAITADKIDAKAITADKITASVIDAINLNAGKATIDSAVIDVAEITTIVAQDIKVGNAQITDLEAEKIKTGSLIADVMSTNVINAVNANIGSATIDSAKIGELTADKITASVIDAINLSAEKISADRIDVTDLKVENIDASKITTGTLDANRIAAGSIDASKIAIGDFSNYITYKPNSTYAQDVNGAVVPTIFLNNNNFQVSQKLYNFKGGEEFLLKGRVFALQHGGKNPYIDFVWRDDNGAYISGRQVSITGLVQGRYQDFSIAVPALSNKPANATNLQLKIQVDTSTPPGQYHFFGLTVNRKNGGELIVDGSITADKITSNAITTEKIDAKAITTEKLAANAITADKIEANQITAVKIATDAIETRHIKAGQIEAGQIKAEAISAIGITASNITADKIASGEIKVGNANIVDGTINGAKIEKATIGDAQIDKAWVADAYIKNLDAGKITTGTLDASRITVKNLNADSITTGSITVEGNNLIHNTMFENTDKWSRASGWNLDTATTFEGQNTMKFSLTGVTSDTWRGLISEKIPVLVGETYVISGYFKSDDYAGINKGGMGMSADIYNADGTRIHYPGSTVPYSVDMNGKWVRHTFSFTITNPESATMSWRTHTTQNGTYWVAKPMVSKGTIASVWKPHNDELISDGAIDNDKLGNQAVTSDKLMTDELFVGENAFINKLKAVEIDAANITTGTISNERIDIKGMISFESFDDTLQEIFNVQGDKTYINGGMIATNTIKADKIDLLSGFTVKGPDGNDTFTIAENGEVSVNGLLKSGNYTPGNLGYKIAPDGTAEFNQAVVRGSIDLPNAGITNYGATIGGENVLKNSNFVSGTANWAAHDMSSGGTNKSITVSKGGDWMPPNDYVLVIRGTNTTNRYGAIQYLTLNPNTKYTLSGYCAAHRVQSLQLNIRDQDSSGANIHTVNISPVSGGNSFDKYYRFETTFTTTANKNYAVNLYTVNCGDNAYAWFGNIKLEEGEKATPWCPNKDEQFNYTRIWAGSSYEGRDSAPFRVQQNGSLYALDGTFEGKLYGELNSGLVHIHNNAIELNKTSVYVDEFGNEQMILPLDGDTDGYIKFTTDQSTINTNLSLNKGAVNYSISDALLGLTNTNFKVTAAMGDVLIDRQSGAFGGLNILGPSGGHHVLRGSTSADKQGTLVFDSEGNQGARGDFSFTRKNYSSESCKVDIDGGLTVKDGINSTKQNIEMRSVANEGWGFYAT